MSDDGRPQHLGDALRQVELTLDNVETVLRTAGMTFANVVQLNTHMTDIDPFMCEAADYMANRLGAFDPKRRYLPVAGVDPAVDDRAPTLVLLAVADAPLDCSTIEHVRQAYGIVAEQYIELFGNSAQVHADDLAFIDRHLSIRPGSVLDVGCGPGHLTAHLRARGVDATGIDLVPTFIDHARATYPGGRYEIGSMHQLPVPDHSLAGILAWYSLIHVPPDDLDGVLAELRRAMTPRGTLVAGFFDGDEITAFEHKVTTAHFWPVDEFSERLQRAGCTEVERWQRPGVVESGRRPHAAIAATVN